MNCRHCNEGLDTVFLDLGYAPPSNAYISSDSLNTPETYYPLKLFVCRSCWLVQTDDYTEADDLFNNEYAYFSSVSSGWLNHAKNYVDMIVERLSLDNRSFVVELAANDGYLLKNFVDKKIDCLGIEPTESTATVAESLNIPIIQEFFNTELATRIVNNDKKQADLIIGNNVYAHVPDINDFTAGMKTLLADNGTITLEFPHLLQLIDKTQFDTVYHEHFSYLSLSTVSKVFERASLKVFDVERLETHGGSLRVYGCHMSDNRQVTANVTSILDEERNMGMSDIEVYTQFQEAADNLKDEFLQFLIEKKRSGKTVAAYGAAAKGCTLLNYAGIKPDLLPYVCDASPHKQGKLLPGSRIPILSPDVLLEKKPDFIVILPWNIKDEVINQLSYVRSWGGQFVTAVPSLQVF